MSHSIAPTVVSACAIALFTTAPGHAQTPPSQSPAAAIPDKPGVVYAERMRTTATVDAVDKDKRTVTLRRPDGRTSR